MILLLILSIILNGLLIYGFTHTAMYVHDLEAENEFLLSELDDLP